VRDALEQAIRDRRPAHCGSVIHHRVCGSPHFSVRYIERLADIGNEPSAGNVGGSYDNALAETIGRLCKAEVVPTRPMAVLRGRRTRHAGMRGPVQQQRLLEPFGNMPLAEAEERYYAMRQEPTKAA